MRGWNSLNGTGQTIVGLVIAALLVLFAFLNGIPWASKSEVAALKTDVLRELTELKTDVREIRRLLHQRMP